MIEEAITYRRLASFSFYKHSYYNKHRLKRGSGLEGILEKSRNGEKKK